MACGDRGAAPSPGEILTARTLGLAYLEEYRLEEAAEEFQKLIRLVPQEAAGYANLGVTYLRMGRYGEATAEFERAVERAPGDPDIRLQLATALELGGSAEAARTILQETLQGAPDHLKTLYAWARMAGGAPADRLTYLQHLVELAPANAAARLELVDALLAAGFGDSALRHLEVLRQRLPSLPPDASGSFERAVRLSRTGDAGAADAARQFHRFFALTPTYQRGLRDLEGPRGAAAGYPVLTLSRALSLRQASPEAVLAALRFTDATAAVGFEALRAPISTGAPGALAVGDYDADGDPDLFVGRGRQASLLRNDLGAFVDATAAAGITRDQPASAARLADLNNDGWLDLVLAGPSGARLFLGRADGSFRDATVAAGFGTAEAVRQLLALDADHDGDLDLFLAGSNRSWLYRNNLNGTFSEHTEAMGFGTPALKAPGAVFGDFNGDARIDVVVGSQDSGAVLYRNAGQARFERVGSSGLPSDAALTAIAAGDYDNDGWLDLFLGGGGNGGELYRNRGDGSFAPDRRGGALGGVFQGFTPRAARFLDFDNDGYLDVIVAGEGTGPGARLLHNERRGRWTDRTPLLPADQAPLADVAAFDPDGDGDPDLLLLALDGSVRLLRNDGGNANHFLKIELVGLGDGSGKNNRFGIGSLVEARVGDLYQMRVVTDPVTLFGLGQRLKADVVRVQWTNGVPQTFYYPGSDRDLLEEQTLKGSCAFLYTWDGERYRFVTDIMWRSAIGMPLGLMTIQSRTYAPPDASREYLRVPGEALKPRNGRYALQITEELWEAPYLDQLTLLTVDHPDSVSIYVDEKFVPPGPAPLMVYQVTRRHLPVAAIDGTGRDVFPELRAQDHGYVRGFTPTRYQGLVEPHDLVLDLGPQARADSVRLFLQGWIFPTDASINVAIGQSGTIAVASPSLQVRDRTGRWRTVIPDIGFPAGKNKTVVVDLTGRFLGPDRQVRIQTTMDIYWDHAFFTAGSGSSDVRITRLAPSSANLHDRGFSRMYRKGGRYGPQWFDYDEVSRESPWRPIIGPFTRYGNVLPLLEAADDRYVVMSPGDEITVQFDAAPAPALPPGWTRDFLLYSDGWMKDADLNTATGERTTPLPFHAMSKYPYGPEERFPHPEFVREWLTRR
jgi:DNA-binding SARP family transcriptional activator